MSSDAEHYRDRLLAWLRTAVEESWLPAEEVDDLQALEARGADQLFEAGAARPLTVALFGGTGVGKSSILNRLVGEPVADVGVERPTSTRVTLYVHEDFPVSDLGSLFPVERTRVLEHRRDEYRDVVWLDMPDIDSIEPANRELVLEWLPCIDWLVYVVSPEKYRDDAGWRVLERRGRRHHWLFVMNHWDTGTDEQYEDFKRLLIGQGLADPLVLRTSCGEAVEDDFDRLAEVIREALERHGLAQLKQVGERARLEDLKRLCDRYIAMLGEAGQWRQFLERGKAVMDEHLSRVARYLRDEAAIQAAGVPDRPPREGAAMPEPGVPDVVVDYVRDLQSGVLLAAQDLPVSPIGERTRSILEPLPGRLAEVFRGAFREGITRPGNAVQRLAAAWIGKLVYGLPLVAGLGIGYFVVTRYESGLSGTAGFLGFDFLVHSLMVLVLAALLPYLLGRLLRPSVRRAIVKLVAAGLSAAHADLLRQWIAAMNELCERSRALAHTPAAVRADIDALTSDAKLGRYPRERGDPGDGS